MTLRIPRRLRLPLAAIGLLAFVACSMGTNTGNGASGETGGTGGFVPGTGGTPSCPIMPCEQPVSAIGPDGVTYRGSVTTNTRFGDSSAPDAGNAPIAELVYSAWAVEYTDLGCVYDSSQMAPSSSIYLCITSAGSWVDSAGALHVHSEPGADMNCTGPQNTTDTWGLTFTLTADGLLTATLFTKPGNSNANAAAQELTIVGQIDATVNIGPWRGPAGNDPDGCWRHVHISHDVNAQRIVQPLNESPSCSERVPRAATMATGRLVKLVDAKNEVTPSFPTT